MKISVELQKKKKGICVLKELFLGSDKKTSES